MDLPVIGLQRFRFITALLVSVCTLLEFITPMFPNQFLLLASLANVGKSIGLTTYVSTQPAVLKSFAKSENVAELSAKQQVSCHLPGHDMSCFPDTFLSSPVSISWSCTGR